MKIVGRVFSGFLRLMMVATILGMIGAAIAKRQLVPLDDEDADEVRLAAIFGPMSFRSTARAFRGGTVDCWYGGGLLDLRDATLDPAGAHLRVRAVFGGAQIAVPETWRVSSNVLGIGGIGDGRAQAERPDDAPLLTIDGVAIFGGFGVMSEVPEAAFRGLESAIARQGHQHEPHPEPTVLA